MDEYYRSQQSPIGDSQLAAAFVSPPRNGPMLPRRFTTDSGRVPTLSSITTNIPTNIQRAPEGQDYGGTTLEKKRMDFERLREAKKRFELEFATLAARERQEEFELAQMADDLRFNGNNLAGRASEPTTPPEYRETSSGFPSIFSRPNRYSTSSLTSPPGLGLFNRPGRSGSQLASPQSGISQSQAQTRFAFDDQLPSRSVPGSRRNSDEDEKEEAVRQDPTSHRSTNALNRYSMPVTRSRTYFADIGLEDSNNTTGFLFDDEDTSAETRNTHQGSTNDAFASILRQQRYSLNMSSLGSAQLNGNTNGNGSSAQSPEATTPNSSRPNSIHRAMDPFNISSAPDTPSSVISPSSSHMATPPKLQQSYSATEMPGVRNSASASGLVGTANNHAQQHLHNHNASIGRIPASAMSNRHSRELSNDSNLANGREIPGFPSISSTLQANAAPFGPVVTQAPNPAATNSVLSPTNSGSYPAYYQAQPAFSPGAYNPTPSPMQQLYMGMGAITLNGGQNGVNGAHSSPIYAPPQFPGHNASYQPPARQNQDSQARVIQSRRQQDSESMARFNNLSLDSCTGQIYTLCKDQHGCRYLQRQIESRDPHAIHQIWMETNQHVVELMTDPFGNYLCQKLLEFCNNEDRTILIQNAAEHMVKIALNQHGTRALQKMIEFVTEDVQISIIVEALRFRVVELIQDLNGNHVIQKCLNKLSSHDAGFIFEAVGHHCVEVGTHRHGCCVLQRCIDHAEGGVKSWLVNMIIGSACQLVQDPFGNYVVQYIIDLAEPSFTEPLVRQFKGRIATLSKHKFSSNVVEKCLRCATEESRDLITDELLLPGEMERLLRDSFANYVIQTALDYATPARKQALVDAIRPQLVSVRTTPYGRRIHAKIQQYENRSSTDISGPGTPSESGLGQRPLRTSNARTMATNTSILTNGGQFNGGVNGNGVASRTIYSQSSNITVPPSLQQQAPPQPPRTQQMPNGSAHTMNPPADDQDGSFF